MKKASKIIVITFAILLNGLIIFESCLPGGISVTRSNWISNIFADIINTFIPGSVEEIPLKSLTLSGNSNIVIGTTNSFIVTYEPANTTFTGIKFEAGDAKINPVQSGSISYVEGLEIGTTTLTVTSLVDESITQTIDISVIERPAPSQFSLSVENEQILNGFSEPVVFSIDGYIENRAVRYFDTSLIQLESSDPSIATVQNGVIHAKSVGTTTIFATDYPSRAIEIEVLSNSETLIYPVDAEWQIIGNNVVHVYDMDHAETEFSQLSIDWGDTIPSDPGITWKVQDELVAKISPDGKLRGYKKTGMTNVIAISNMDPTQEKVFPISVLEVMPTGMEIHVTPSGGPLNQIFTVGDTISIRAIFSPINTTNLYIDVKSSDDGVLLPRIEGRTGKVLAKDSGTATLTVTSIANPSLTETLTFEVQAKKAIDGEGYKDFASFIRKAFGHFLLFGASAVFSTWSMFLILDKSIKKKWLIILISTLFGLFIAGGTELIQLFVPLRSGSIIDIGIDLIGYIAFTALTVLVGYLIGRHRKKMQANKKKD